METPKTLQQNCLSAIDFALKIQADAAALGFDWSDITGALDKVVEEVQELKAALVQNERKQALNELGDLFFSLLNVSRFLDADPLICLNSTSDRFQKRFALVKQLALEERCDLKNCTDDQLDCYWERAKKLVAQ